MDARRLTIEDVIRQPLPGMDAPGSLAFSQDGSRLGYLYAADGGSARGLWQLDLADGQRRLLVPAEAGATQERALSREEELRRERRRIRALGITSFSWSGDLLVVPAGDRVLVARGREAPRALDALQGAIEVRPSPDGQAVAFVRDGDLWVLPLDEDVPRRLTRDAAPGVFNGLPEYIAAEELDRHDGFWWSADGATIACALVDERHVPEFPIPHLAGERLEVETHRYPFAGAANARVSLRVLDADGSRQPTAVELGTGDGYLARVLPLPDGAFLIGMLDRAQTELRWLRIDPDGVRGLWIEHGSPWLNLDGDSRALADGRILRSTERSGHRHLELRTAEGSLLGQLTHGSWSVTGVAHVDTQRGEVLFMATTDSPLERHCYAVGLDGGAPRRLTPEPGWHEVTVAPDGSRWADTWHSREAAPQVAIRSRAGEIEDLLHEPSSSPERLGVVPPELLEVTAADGRTALHAAFYRPAAGRLDQAAPLAVSVYGGPHSQRVANAWTLTVDLRAQLLAQHGVAVLLVDNRGTANRGLAFESELDRRFGGVEVDDQAAAVEQVAGSRAIDRARVALYGWSYGGYLAIRCLQRRPDLFRVAVAGAPVSDWDGYDTAYTERYLGQPSTDADAYRRASLLHEVDALRGRLLLIHGLLDENVHFRHTARLLASLHEAGGDCELLVLPDERHAVRDEASLRLRERRTLEFLLRELGVDDRIRG